MQTPRESVDAALHAISDPTRRRILQILKARISPGSDSASHNVGLCAGEIETRVQLSQPTISHHMAILSKAGLVVVSKRGQWRWYRRNEQALRLLLKRLRAQL